MDVLKLGSPLTTLEPRVLLDPELAPGRYRVTLVVGGAGGESAPAELSVTIQRQATDGGVVSPVGPFADVVSPAIVRPPVPPLIATPLRPPGPLPRGGAGEAQPGKPKPPRKPK